MGSPGSALLLLSQLADQKFRVADNIDEEDMPVSSFSFPGSAMCEAYFTALTEASFDGADHSSGLANVESN